MFPLNICVDYYIVVIAADQIPQVYLTIKTSYHWKILQIRMTPAGGLLSSDVVLNQVLKPCQYKHETEKENVFQFSFSYGSLVFYIRISIRSIATLVFNFFSPDCLNHLLCVYSKIYQNI